MNFFMFTPETTFIFWHCFGITLQLLNYIVLLRITDEGLVPEMCIWPLS